MTVIVFIIGKSSCCCRNSNTWRFLFLVSLLQPAIFKAYQEGELLWGTIGEEEDHFVGSAIKMKLIRRPIYIASKDPDEEKQVFWVAALENARKRDALRQLRFVKETPVGIDLPIILHGNRYYLAAGSFVLLGQAKKMGGNKSKNNHF